MSIKVKRGLAINLPTLEEGELGFTTDSYEMYVGSDNGNILLNNGEILIRRNNGMLQYAQSNRKNQWFDICSLEEIRGDQGVQGIQGIQGVKGDKGDKGERGIQGEKGNPFTYADFTPDQLRALKGEKGDTGAKGERGLTGDKGDRGVGLNYAWSGTRLGVKRDTDAQYTYVDLRGADGKDGKQGERGEQGIPGEKGDTPSIAHLEQQVSDKSKELDTKFNTLTAKQQQDAEVVTARDGEVSLNARLERDLAKGKIHFVDVEGSNISTESEEGYLENVEIFGNTWQNAENLADIRSVGDKVEGQELYEIPLIYSNENLFDKTQPFNEAFGNPTYDKSVKYDFENDLLVTQGQHGVASSSSQKHKLKPNTTYSFYAESVGTTHRIGVKDNGEYLGESSADTQHIIKHTFTTKTGDVRITYIRANENPTGLYGLKNISLVEGDMPKKVDRIENKLTILSPTPLEKVGDIADRINCKDGVWGVEKNVETIITNGNENIINFNYAQKENSILFGIKVDNAFPNQFVVCDKLISKNIWSVDEEGIYITGNKELYIRLAKNKFNTQDVIGAKEILKNKYVIKYVLEQPQFIPLPHDQQITLRTFANKTNIHFDTEIQPTLKAQVPKSLGATVNTHTSQIDNLNKELDRVKKLEESTVTTVTSDKAFTTIAETSGGYFEDVKIKGKTLVNLFNLDKMSWNAGATFENGVITLTNPSNSWGTFDVELSTIKPNTQYTLIVNLIENTTNESIYIHNRDETNGYFKNFSWKKKNDLGVSSYLVTTFDDVINKRYSVRTNTKTEGQYAKLQILILEGDHTDKDITFFEGLKSVGQDSDEISVSSVNENLFVLDNLKPNESARNIIKVENGIIYIRGAWGESCTNPMFLKPNTTYFFNAKIRVDTLPTVADSTTEKYVFKMLLHDNKNSKYLSVPGANNLYEGAKVGDILEYKSSFTTPTDIELYTKLLLYGIKSGDASASTCGHISILDISVSESEGYVLSKQDKKQVLYYNPTTQTWEKPVLREWDSIEKHSDGKYYYHKRSGEVVLNGSESWIESTGFKSDTHKVFQFTINNAKERSSVICDKFKYLVIDGSRDGIEFAYKKNVYICIENSKSQDVQGFKTWLQANPVTVVYQLAEEEVYECTNLDLITYNGETNLIVNSGAIQPKLELKVLSNVSNVVKLLQEKVSILENKFIKGLQQVLAGDMMSLAHLLYPEDFTLENDTPQVIPYIEEGDINE